VAEAAVGGGEEDHERFSVAAALLPGKTLPRDVSSRVSEDADAWAAGPLIGGPPASLAGTAGPPGSAWGLRLLNAELGTE
jgi:hypothetical protein